MLTKMTKQQTITAILEAGKIHHNISISWNKMPDYTDDDTKNGYDWQDIAGYMLDQFVETWQEEPINDSGNRNLCECKKNAYITRCDTCYRKTWYEEEQKCHIKNCTGNLKLLTHNSYYMANGACKKHDLWNIFTHGRMGATLFWDKYWKSTNSGFYFKKDWDDELKEMPVTELKTILKEIEYFNKTVTGLMDSFYAECKYKLEESREEKAKEEKEEKLYNNLKNQIIKNSFSKRLINELVNEKL